MPEKEVGMPPEPETMPTTNMDEGKRRVKHGSNDEGWDISDKIGPVHDTKIGKNSLTEHTAGTATTFPMATELRASASGSKMWIPMVCHGRPAVQREYGKIIRREETRVPAHVLKSKRAEIVATLAELRTTATQQQDVNIAEVHKKSSETPAELKESHRIDDCRKCIEYDF